MQFPPISHPRGANPKGILILYSTSTVLLLVRRSELVSKTEHGSSRGSWVNRLRSRPRPTPVRFLIVWCLPGAPPATPDTRGPEGRADFSPLGASLRSQRYDGPNADALALPPNPRTRFTREKKHHSNAGRGAGDTAPLLRSSPSVARGPAPPPVGPGGNPGGNPGGTRRAPQQPPFPRPPIIFKYRQGSRRSSSEWRRRSAGHRPPPLPPR